MNSLGPDVNAGGANVRVDKPVPAQNRGLAGRYNERTMSARHHAQRRSAGARAGRILALDYGRRRIGLAVSDELALTAQPLTTLQRTNRRDDVRRLRDAVRRWNVTRIVVGHPVRLDGTSGTMAEEVAQFAGRLQKALGIPVELADERLSSWEAEQTVSAREGRGSRNRLDAVAAAVILRSYLERERQREQA